MKLWPISLGLCFALTMGVITLCGQQGKQQQVLVSQKITAAGCAAAPNYIATTPTGHYRAQSLGLANDAAVNTWTDISGNGRDTTALVTQATYKTNILNGKAVIRFDSTDAYASAAALSTFITNSAYTTYAVFNASSVSTNSANSYDNVAIWRGHAGFAGLFLKSAPTAHAYNWDGSDDNASVAITTSTWVIVTTKHEAGNISIRLNNGSYTSVASGNTSDLSGVIHISRATVGPFAGDMAEVIFYNSALSSGDDATVLNCLNEPTNGYAIF